MDGAFGVGQITAGEIDFFSGPSTDSRRGRRPGAIWRSVRERSRRALCPRSNVKLAAVMRANPAEDHVRRTWPFA
jgi:hypothetical protein